MRRYRQTWHEEDYRYFFAVLRQRPPHPQKKHPFQTSFNLTLYWRHEPPALYHHCHSSDTPLLVTSFRNEIYCICRDNINWLPTATELTHSDARGKICNRHKKRVIPASCSVIWVRVQVQLIGLYRTYPPFILPPPPQKKRRQIEIS